MPTWGANGAGRRSAILQPAILKSDRLLVLYRVMRSRLKLAGAQLAPERALEQLRAIQRQRVRINGAAQMNRL